MTEYNNIYLTVPTCVNETIITSTIFRFDENRNVFYPFWQPFISYCTELPV